MRREDADVKREDAEVTREDVGNGRGKTPSSSFESMTTIIRRSSSRVTRNVWLPAYSPINARPRVMAWESGVAELQEQRRWKIRGRGSGGCGVIDADNTHLTSDAGSGLS